LGNALQVRRLRRRWQQLALNWRLVVGLAPGECLPSELFQTWKVPERLANWPAV
jgi:hypothetical protein